MEQDFPASPLGLYIHIPFCLSRCGYCSFFSVPYRKSALNEYVDYLHKEKALYQSQLNRPLATIYFGGGTPSLLNAEQIMDLLSGLNILPKAEITLEINPLQITENYLQTLNKTPVNRLSIGVQSMNPEELNWLERQHKPEQIQEKIALCRQFGYQNISLDLIYGLPNSSVQSLQRTVEKYLTLKPEHISCYLLTLDNDCRKAKERAFLPDEEMQAEQYEFLCNCLKQEGYIHYEISNFALSGYASQHNLRYWHSDDYLALGASAAGWITPIRYQNPADLNLYYQSVDKGEAFPQREELSEQRIVQDYLMMGLRLKEGIDLDEFNNRFRFKLTALYEAKISKLQKIGMLNLTEHNLALSEKALFVSNSVIGDLIL
ncbi:MAG: Oxygen-independent coproporphyrinogen-III oxidase 1 [Candidatus Cloacimonetes bacterium ADurb.Bin089]|nr:MAG: Oxygen-independent coproporphyrinogen-III oxidase 1 [Candidatus Cloacimonetes bacterium ADurb.Bin089]